MSEKQRPDLRAMMAEGAGLHGQGRLDEAAALYRQILAQVPQDFDATQLLGVVALQQGQYEIAQRLISAAITINPHDAPAIGNLGVSYMDAGQAGSALEWFSVALKLQPDSVAALLNVGMALQRLGRQREAIPALQKAFDLDPNQYVVCIRLGECLLAAGETRNAVDAFESATLAEPGVATGWAMLSAAWDAAGEHQRAQECLARARSLPSTSGVAPSTEEVPPSRPSAHVLRQTAYALVANGLNEAGIDQLRRALVIEPTSLTARIALAMAHLKCIYEAPAEIAASRELFSRSVAEVSSWYQQNAHQLQEAYKALGVVQPFMLAYHPFSNREFLVSYGNLCVALMATLPPTRADSAANATAGRHSPDSEGRIRLGIASPHIKEHSVWDAITKGWVDHIDQSKFEIHLFQLNHDSDAETDRARRVVAHVEDAPFRVEDWARVIAASELDVLIYPSVGMDPLTQQLAALRLAPLQATTWGHPETTGFSTIDLYLSAEFLESPTADQHYSERLVRLPNLGVYVEPLAPPPVTLKLGELGLPDDEPLLLCPGTPFKYSPLFDDVWVAIARGLRKQMFRRTGGRLVFFRRGRIAPMDRALEARMRGAFARAGLEFDAHVSILEALDRPRYYALMRQSALLLDTLGFSGFNTAIQAIECGLPVLAFEGEFMRGRLASGLMRKLNLPELVATTPQQFIDTAIDLSRNDKKREALRGAMVERRECLFRDLTTVRALEECLAGEVLRARKNPGA